MLVLLPDHVQSYRHYMNSHLFDRVNIDKSKTNVPSGVAADPAEECQRYEQLIRDMGGIDLQLLGLGKTCHIGFNEPGERFETITHVVTLNEQTRKDNSRFFASIDEVPKKAGHHGDSDHYVGEDHCPCGQRPRKSRRACGSFAGGCEAFCTGLYSSNASKRHRSGG